MYSFILDEMKNDIIRKLIDAEIIIDPADISEAQVLIKISLATYWQDYIADVWHIDDIDTVVEIINKEQNTKYFLTKNEARFLLRKILSYKNPDIGINWKILKTTVLEFLANTNRGING
jgi:hypothetical protein